MIGARHKLLLLGTKCESEASGTLWLCRRKITNLRTSRLVLKGQSADYRTPPLPRHPAPLRHIRATYLGTPLNPPPSRPGLLPSTKVARFICQGPGLQRPPPLQGLAVLSLFPASLPPFRAKEPRQKRLKKKSDKKYEIHHNKKFSIQGQKWDPQLGPTPGLANSLPTSFLISHTSQLRRHTKATHPLPTHLRIVAFSFFPIWLSP